MFKIFCKEKIIDTSVYREGLFRTYLSTKSGESRPLIKSVSSDNFEFEDVFVANCSEDVIIDTDSNDFNKFLKRDIQEKKIENHNIEHEIEDVMATDLMYLPTQKELTITDCDIIKRFVRKNYKYRNY